MDYNSTLTFVTDPKNIKLIDAFFSTENYIETQVISYDVKETDDDSMFTICIESNNDNTFDIFEAHEVVSNETGIDDLDVIFVVSDGIKFIDVISVSGNYDTHVSDDSHVIEELCKTYGLPYYGYDEEAEDDEEYEYGFDEDWEY